MNFSKDMLKQILNRLGSIICTDPDKKCFDKKIAEGLNISTAKLTSAKNRQTLPFEDIINFCKEKKVSLDWIILGERDIEHPTVREKKVPISSLSDTKDIKLDKAYAEMIGIDSNSDIMAINLKGGLTSCQSKSSVLILDKNKKELLHNETFAFTPTASKQLLIRVVKLHPVSGITLVSKDGEAIHIEDIDKLNIVGQVIGQLSGV